MYPVRITVLKTECYPDLADAYLTDGAQVGPCPLHAPGDTCLYTGGAEKPDGLCPWAWIDLYHGITSLANGPVDNGWYRYGDKRIVCCTDGVRPVVFELTVLGGALQ